MSLSFSTSSVTAIGQSIQQRTDLIVLLTDDSDNSKSLEKFVNSIPSINLINNSKCTCLKIESGSVDAENIQKTFPDIKTPSVSVIGTNPTGLKISITMMEGLTIGGFMGMLVQNISKQNNDGASTSTQEKAEILNKKLENIRRAKAEKAKDEELEKEKKRIEDGKKLAEIKKKREEEEWAENAAKRAEERKKDREAKNEMAKIMREEKEARLEKNRRLREEAEKRREEEAKNKPKEVAGRKVLVGVSLPNGSQPRKQFSCETDTLEDLINWTQVLVDDAPLSSYHLVSKGDWSADISPSKSERHIKLKHFYSEKFTRAQYKLTFFGNSSSSKLKNISSKSNAVTETSIIGSIFGIISSIIMVFVNLIKSVLGGGGNLSDDSGNPSEPVVSRPENINRSNQGDSESIRKRRTARLHDLKRDEDNTTYNGNSSAQL